MNTKNIFKNIPYMEDECLEDILVNKTFRIERIVSKGHTTAEGYWYDQETNEWVMLLSGSAIILFENNSQIKMEPGDYINIPAHTKHRVTFTDTQIETVWLAIHYQ
jgi:cupin 2 domain-containing protein